MKITQKDFVAHSSKYMKLAMSGEVLDLIDEDGNLRSRIVVPQDDLTTTDEFERGRKLGVAEGVAQERARAWQSAPSKYNSEIAHHEHECPSADGCSALDCDYPGKKL